MGVIVSDVKAVKDPECINCNICVDTCPKGSLTVNVVRWKVPLYAYAMLVVGLFFLAIGVAKATGVWQSVPPVSLTDASGNLDATSIKGWMTLDDVSKETGISVSEMIVALDLPSGMDTSVPLRIGSKYGIVFETEDLREFVANYEMTTSLPEQSCPWGIEDDPYPGRCGLYDDKDGNGACDLSE